MIIGYVRVSTGGQTVENQRLAIYEAGYKPDQWFELSVSSRKSFGKRRIDELIEIVGKGDLVVVAELSRLSRSIGQTIILIDKLQEVGAGLHCLKEGIKLDGKKQDIQSKVMTTMFALFAEIERDLISERTKEGIERARKEGKTLGRPKGPGKSKLDEKRAEIVQYLGIGLNVTAIAKLVGGKWSTVDHYIKTRDLRSEIEVK
jgi:DNA invertase Pin-like site-specific DNA recombinase